MTHLHGCELVRRRDVKWTLLRAHLRVVRRFFRLLQDHLLACSSSNSLGSKPPPYRRIKMHTTGNAHVVLEALPAVAAQLAPVANNPPALPAPCPPDGDSDTVALKISLLGDCHIGKTSFMTKYVGEGEEQHKGLQMSGLNLMDKSMSVRGARIVFSIWDVGGDRQFGDHIPIACKDAAAILIMFDLTNRCSLNNAMDWYQQARRWNKTGIPILVGTKFDDFIQLPLDMQWTIVNQARAAARAMNATLFFSSTTHDINVNKIFKFITAKFFNLPWTVERNLTLGEPTIDF